MPNIWPTCFELGLERCPEPGSSSSSSSLGQHASLCAIHCSCSLTATQLVWAAVPPPAALAAPSCSQIAANCKQKRRASSGKAGWQSGVQLAAGSQRRQRWRQRADRRRCSRFCGCWTPLYVACCASSHVFWIIQSAALCQPRTCPSACTGPNPAGGGLQSPAAPNEPRCGCLRPDLAQGPPPSRASAAAAPPPPQPCQQQPPAASLRPLYPQRCARFLD